MAEALHDEIAGFALQVIRDSIRTGLSWSQVTAALGLAAKAIAVSVPAADELERQSHLASAEQRLIEAFSIDVKLVSVAGICTNPSNVH